MAMNIEHSSSTNEITYCTPISTDRRLRPLAEREGPLEHHGRVEGGAVESRENAGGKGRCHRYPEGQEKKRRIVLGSEGTGDV